MSLHALLADLGRRIGLDLAPGPQGTASLLLDDRHAINLEPSGDGLGVHLYTVAGRMPEGAPERARLAEELLAANLFGEASGEARFALDPLADEVVLCRTLPLAGTDAGALEAAIEDMASRIEAWERRSPAAAPAPAEPVVAETWIRG